MSGLVLGQQFALREPRILLLAALFGVLAIGLWLRRGRGRLPWTAVLVRALAVLAFAIALAQPSVARPVPTGATVFVLDRSRSIGDERLGAVEEQLRDAIAANAGSEPLGLVVFAERAAVVYPVGALVAEVPAGPDSGAREAAIAAADVGSRDYTDLAGALRLAEALPSSGGKRLVLLSDGQETLGQALNWAAGAAARGVTIDALRPSGPPRTGDWRLTGLWVPESVWQGDDIEVEALVAGAPGGSATVRLLVDGRPAGERPVDPRAFAPGADVTTVRFALRPLAPGYHAVRVEVVPQGVDTIAENNALAATTVVRDKPRVLILEGQRFAGDGLRRALERTGSDVTVREPATLTERLSDLAPFDVVVLVDVSAEALSFDRQKALQEFVRSLGHGLVVVGGMNSFGRGGYERTTLEEVLPVRVKPRPEGKRPPAALLLIIDTSSSMDYPRNAPTRMEMAKTAAIGAVRSLSPGDEVAILAFSDGSNWVTPLRAINSAGDVNAVVDQISRLRADGLTQMYPALRAGIDELGKSRLETRHIVFLSDGAPSNSFDDGELTARVRAAGLTLSSIAIGDGASVDLMQRLAKGGNGRYSFARTPEDIPRLTLEEANQLTGKTLATGDFRAVQVAPSPILRGLDPARLPTLGGYQITEARPDAQPILVSGRGEPVLAQWQYGLGRVVAWTSDLSQELAPNWKDAAAFAPLWNGAIRWTLAASSSHYFRVTATPDDRDLLLTVDAFDEGGMPVNLAETTATLRTPGGASVPLVLPQSAPGRYEVRLSGPAPGAYGLELQQVRKGRTIVDVAGFRVPYPAELRGPSGDGATLGALADRTGGRVIADAGAVFDARAEVRAPRFQPVWPPFVVLGLGLFLLDIALRLGHAATPTTLLRRLMPR